MQFAAKFTWRKSVTFVITPIIVIIIYTYGAVITIFVIINQKLL